MIVTIWQWLRYLSIRQVIPIRTVDNLVSECVEMRWPEFLANTKLLPIQNSDSQVLLSHYPSNGCIDPCWWVACGVVGPKGHISNFWLLNTFVHSRDCLHLFIFGSGCHIINVAHSESIAGVHITYDCALDHQKSVQCNQSITIHLFVQQFSLFQPASSNL